jgi:hypothetical protein
MGQFLKKNMEPRSVVNSFACQCTCNYPDFNLSILRYIQNGSILGDEDDKNRPTCLYKTEKTKIRTLTMFPWSTCCLKNILAVKEFVEPWMFTFGQPRRTVCISTIFLGKFKMSWKK